MRGALLDPAELYSDLDRAIELERDGRRGDPQAEAKHWLDKLTEAEEERRGFLRLAARGSMTDAELDEELAQLDDARRVAEQELEALRQHNERVEEMERDRDAVLEHYTALAPEALDSLTPEERHHLYKMLRLKVFVAKGGDLVIELAGVPAESTDAKRSSTSEVTSPFILIVSLGYFPDTRVRRAVAHGRHGGRFSGIGRAGWSCSKVRGKVWFR